MSNHQQRPLAGVRVLDLSRVLAGPYCGGLLADMGADVVKIESPAGDDARHLGPFSGSESVYFAQLNRGKRSVVLNLKQPDHLEQLRELVANADVLLENFRPGVTTRLGIDWPTLREINPRLIYASISGFGQSGPFSSRPAYDLIIQAMSGIMAATGPTGSGPTRVGESLADVVSGVFTGWGICAALFDRERTGEGRHIDTSMFDSLLALQVTSMSMLTAAGVLPGRIGNRHPVSVPFDTYETTDGMVAIAVANDVLWARLCTVMEAPELGTDPRYLGDANRSALLAEITTLVSTWTKSQTTAEVLAAAEHAGIPAAPIWDLKQALTSEHVAARGSVGSFYHPQLGKTPYLRLPMLFGDGPCHPADGTSPSPDLGASTVQEILAAWSASHEKE